MKGISPLIAAVLLISFTMAIGGVLLIWSSTFSQQRISSAEKCSLAMGIDSNYIESSKTLAKSVNIRIRNKADGDLTGLKASILYYDSSKNLDGIPIAVESNRVLVAAKGTLSTGETTNAVIEVTDKGYPSKIEVVSAECPTNSVAQILIPITSTENDFFDEYTVADWTFDEGSGNTISGSPTGTCYGMGASCNWVQGKFGSAIKFDGIDDYISIPYSPEFRLTGPFTVEAWFNQNKNQTGQNVIVTRGGTTNINYRLTQPSGTDTIELRIANSTGRQDLGSIKPELNQWYYVVGTYDGNTMKIYINGVLNASKDIGSVIVTDSSNLYIGAQGASSGFFNGTIDEVRILNFSRIM